jgi:hypothetical protein
MIKYVVRLDDTLQTVADKFGTTPLSIALLDIKQCCRELKPGEQLQISSGDNLRCVKGVVSMCFEEAFHYLRTDNKIRRAVWSPGVFLTIKYPRQIYQIDPSLNCGMSGGRLWIPQQADLFNTDWELLPDEAV